MTALQSPVSLVSAGRQREDTLITVCFFAYTFIYDHYIDLGILHKLGSSTGYPMLVDAGQFTIGMTKDIE